MEHAALVVVRTSPDEKYREELRAAQAEVARLTEQVAGARNAALEEAARMFDAHGPLFDWNASQVRALKSADAPPMYSQADRIEFAEAFSRLEAAKAEQRGRDDAFEQIALYVADNSPVWPDDIRALAGQARTLGAGAA